MVAARITVALATVAYLQHAGLSRAQALLDIHYIRLPNGATLETPAAIDAVSSHMELWLSHTGA